MPFLTSIMHGKKEPVSYFIALLLKNKKPLRLRGFYRTEFVNDNSNQNHLIFNRLYLQNEVFEPLLEKNNTK